jgi:hypothetical protein
MPILHPVHLTSSRRAPRGGVRVLATTALAAALLLPFVPAVRAAEAATPSAEHPGSSPVGSVALSDEALLTRWAHPAERARVTTQPSRGAKAVGRLHLLTEDGFPEIYLLLSTWTDSKGRQWVRVRLPARPNGKKGWVRRDALGDFYRVTTRLVVDRSRLRATLYRSGKRIFEARVGVGKASTPTPSGRFWIREKFRVVGTTLYGTRAMGTSAYAPTLSDWPGGGVVGLHGTNEPGLIPGRPSHGCVRLRNADIERLYRLAPRGTPVQII